MKLRKENVSHGNTKLRILELKDSGLGLGTRSLRVLGMGTMGHVSRRCCVPNFAAARTVEALSPSLGVPVAGNGVCLYLNWQTAFSGAVPTVRYLKEFRGP